MPQSSILFIVNPAAASGTTQKKWEKSYPVIRSYLGPIESVITSSPGHATTITADALRAGYERIIGVGGDGTFNEILNGYFLNQEPINPDAKMGMLIQGTGRDLSRSLKLSKQLERTLQTIKADHSRCIDAGHIQYSANQQYGEERYFANIASFGLGGEVDLLMKHRFQKLGWNGSIAYLLAILTSLATYSLKQIKLEVDGDITWEGRIRNVAIANGKYFGGGLQIAPSALLNDGMLDVIVIGDISIAYLLRHAHYFYQGRHQQLKGIHCFKGRKITVEGPHSVKMDVDGEPFGNLPASFSIIPNALNILY